MNKISIQNDIGFSWFIASRTKVQIIIKEVKEILKKSDNIIIDFDWITDISFSIKNCSSKIK